MGMNDTPAANRIHIGFFGRRNAGKSSVVNAVTNQEISIVSEEKGTTTDPVTKTMELLPLGPVVIIDTPGYDDVGTLGELRVKKTKMILNRTDLAVLVVDATEGKTEIEDELLHIFETKKIPHLIVYNKCDLLSVSKMRELVAENSGENVVLVSATDKRNISQLLEQLSVLVDTNQSQPLVVDLVDKDDVVILVTPVDSAAPKGRLILPQQQVLRELLDVGAISIVIKPEQIEKTFSSLSRRPRMVITDSQAFDYVANHVPEDILLTSFSILMARYKGFLKTAVAGAEVINSLANGDRILICEGCTHHRQCDDIGTVKLPRWLEEYTGKQFDYKFSSGGGFQDDLSGFSLIIHCGGCMLNEREVKYRMKCAEDAEIPFTNYGTVIACTQGILSRTLEVFQS